MGRAIARMAIRMAIGLAALSGIPGGAWAAPPKCDLAVSISPPTIQAGSRTARVRIAAEGSDIRFRASSGSVGPPIALGTEAIVAEFTAAPSSPPVAVIAAVGESTCGFSVVRIAAAGAARASGPVALTVVQPAAARADQDSDVLVYAFAVDGQGTPRQGAAPSFRASVGSVAGVAPLAPGVWRGRWHLPAGKNSDARVEAAFGAEPPAVTALALNPGPPAAIEIAKDLVSEGGGDGTSTAVLVHILDSAGNLTEGPLELESNVAKLGRPGQLERGVYRASLMVPPGTRSESFVVTARTDGIEARATFSITASAAAAVRVTPHGPIRVDASSRGQLEVLHVAVLDAQGSPVGDVPVGSGTRGTFKAAYRVGPGQWALPYLPPPITEDTTEQVVITAGTASTTVDLELLPSRLSLTAGLKAGVAAAGGGAGPAIGTEGAAWTRFGRNQVGLVIELSWWMQSSSSTPTVDGVASSYQATQYYPSLLVSAAGRKQLGDRWMLWATLGAGVGVVSNRAELAGQPTVSEYGLVPVASGSLSVTPLFLKVPLFLEARLTWVGDPGMATMSGASTTFLGLLGYRFDVG